VPVYLKELLMAFISPDPVASGRSYEIVRSVVGAPDDLSDFIGETTFEIDKGGAESAIKGSGARDGTGVRFYEKDVEHSGKDVRAWHISRDPAGTFVATPLAAW
jgi:hypothetical protein